jgi:hypothetical protein
MLAAVAIVDKIGAIITNERDTAAGANNVYSRLFATDHKTLLIWDTV